MHETNLNKLSSRLDEAKAVVAWGEANKGAGRVQDTIADFMPLLRFVEIGHAFIHNRVRQSRLDPERILLDVVDGN